MSSCDVTRRSCRAALPRTHPSAPPPRRSRAGTSTTRRASRCRTRSRGCSTRTSSRRWPSASPRLRRTALTSPAGATEAPSRRARSRERPACYGECAATERGVDGGEAATVRRTPRAADAGALVGVFLAVGAFGEERRLWWRWWRRIAAERTAEQFPPRGPATARTDRPRICSPSVFIGSSRAALAQGRECLPTRQQRAVHLLLFLPFDPHGA